MQCKRYDRVNHTVRQNCPNLCKFRGASVYPFRVQPLYNKSYSDVTQNFFSLQNVLVHSIFIKDQSDPPAVLSLNYYIGSQSNFARVTGPNCVERASNPPPPQNHQRMHAHTRACTRIHTHAQERAHAHSTLFHCDTHTHTHELEIQTSHSNPKPNERICWVFVDTQTRRRQRREQTRRLVLSCAQCRNHENMKQWNAKRQKTWFERYSRGTLRGTLNHNTSSNSMCFDWKKKKTATREKIFRSMVWEIKWDAINNYCQLREGS